MATAPTQDGWPVNQAYQVTGMKPWAWNALVRFRFQLEDTIQRNCLFDQPKQTTPSSKDVTLWGVPLLPSKGHPGTNVVLCKFLEASGYRVPEAFEMLKETLRWRRMYVIDTIGDEQLGGDSEKFVYIDGVDREGRPVWFNTYGADLKDRELYSRHFGSSKSRTEFMRCIVQSLESGIEKLSFKDGGVDSLVHVADMTNLGNPKMKELKDILWTSLVICRHRYPEIIRRHIMINVPFWYYVFHKLSAKLVPWPNNSKFVLARPSRVTQTLLKYIEPEDLPRHYGGLKREGDDEFSELDKATEVVIGVKSAKRIVIPFTEAGATVVWDVAVVGGGVSYKEEFVPEDDCSYQVLIRKTKRLREVVRGSYYINEPGNIVITVRNKSFGKKKVLYRTKLKPTVPMYLLLKS
ncbi:hypothetical protein MLD38_020229 [Melastoma candidum]|uniref:Uncharacterized protein n=1 Tax=Melastoma candidum TaxID=119954 RepID=A0ACB9QE48_9MYRT|nr:hypothetical protein MLD38_020229 [Melastoma candidum]